jgi:hypothetical protein
MMTQYGAVQHDYIKKVREQINREGVGFLNNNNWREISPKGGIHDISLLNKNNKITTHVDAFYVKSIASWVPHLIIENHVPQCPKMNSPKILYGVDGHKYLDTLLYPCRGCARMFAGHNKTSMQLDAQVYYGYFNYYLGKNYAVDEQLYRQIIFASTRESTSSISRRRLAGAYDAYYRDYQLYLSAVGRNKIRPKKKQRTLDTFLQPATEDRQRARLEQKKNEKASIVKHLQLSLTAAKNRQEADVVFSTILCDKTNHNVTG